VEGIMPKRRNYTQELLAKKAQGAVIVISLYPYYGVPVSYEPRNSHDPEPWTAGLEVRFCGRECHAIAYQSIGQLDKDLVLRHICRRFAGSFSMGCDSIDGFDVTDEQLVLILSALTVDGLLERKGLFYYLTPLGRTRLADLGEENLSVV
jgi:hypothetical protein